MEATDFYFPNGAGDTLSKIASNEKAAMYEVLGKDASRKDIFFVAELKPSFEEGGKKMHLAGGNAWESSGKYFKGREAAKAYFEKLNPDQQKIDDQTYYKL